MTRAKAIEAASAEARRFIGDLADYRRKHPLLFYILHRDAATRSRLDGRDVKAWYHRQWRRLYKRRALASEQAEQCRSVVECL